MHKYLRSVAKYIATLGPIGYVPEVPGTAGTIAAIPIVYALRTYITIGWGIDERFTLFAIAAATIWLIQKSIYAGIWFQGDDPSEIVIDEVVGLAVAMYRLSFGDWRIVALVFVLFRFYDIVKPLSIDHIQTMPGGWGIVLDDVVAGAFANVTLMIMLRLI